MRRLIRLTPVFVALLLLVALAQFLPRAAVSGAAAVQSVSSWVLPLFSAAIAIGWITMALIEIVKPTIRGYYHRELLHRREAYAYPPPDDSRSWWFLSELASGDHYFYELPIEKLTAQLQLAGEQRIRDGDGDYRRSSDALQRDLDALQRTAEAEWRTLVRVAAVAVSGSISAAGLLVLGDLREGWFAAAPFVVASAIIGGHFASLARDITAVVERLRR